MPLHNEEPFLSVHVAGDESSIGNDVNTCLELFHFNTFLKGSWAGSPNYSLFLFFSSHLESVRSLMFPLFLSTVY